MTSCRARNNAQVRQQSCTRSPRGAGDPSSCCRRIFLSNSRRARDPSSAVTSVHRRTQRRRRTRRGGGRDLVQDRTSSTLYRMVNYLINRFFIFFPGFVTVLVGERIGVENPEALTRLHVK